MINCESERGLDKTLTKKGEGFNFIKTKEVTKQNKTKIKPVKVKKKEKIKHKSQWNHETGSLCSFNVSSCDNMQIVGLPVAKKDKKSDLM